MDVQHRYLSILVLSGFDVVVDVERGVSKLSIFDDAHGLKIHSTTR